jgi:prevent-host-death family protein
LPFYPFPFRAQRGRDFSISALPSAGSTPWAAGPTLASMTKTADVKDVAAHFAEWLKEVAAGHEVVVTESGRPVARVVRPAATSRETSHQPPPGTASPGPKAPAPAGELLDWVRAHAHQGRPRSHQPVSQSELADELLSRE